MAESNLPYTEFIPYAPHVPPVHIASQDPVLLPLILSRFDTIERMVLGLYTALANPLNATHLPPVNVPQRDAAAPPASSAARPRKPVPIIPPSSPEHSASGTPEPKDCDLCSQPFNPTNPKWKVCDSCDAKSRRESRDKKLRKGKIPCDTEDCLNTVSPSSASGLCHVCWWKTHRKCHFCPGTLRTSEESHICGRCRNRFRTWHRSSGKNGYRVTEQSGQVGRLFAKGGRFEPFSDQEEATAKLSDYREFIEITALDETERRNSASRRRADSQRERDTAGEKALSKWKSGLSVTFVPTEHEALQDANASCPEETSTFPVTFTPHLPSISGMSPSPSIGGKKPLPTHTTGRESSDTDTGAGPLDFPVSSGKYHSMLTAGFSKSDALSFDDVTFRPYEHPLRTPTSSLLPKGETYRTSRPGAAIPIVTPPLPEIRESLFPLVPPTATRSKPTSVSPPLVKDRGSGIDDTLSSAPSPALVRTFTTSVDVAPQEVAAQQIPVDSENTSESLEGDAPKVPRLPQPPPTAAINADAPSQAEISKATVKVLPVFKLNCENTIMGSLENESDRVTKVPKPEPEVVSTLPLEVQWRQAKGLPIPASLAKTISVTSLAKDTTPPPKSTFTSQLLRTTDVREDAPPRFLADDYTTCTQMCSVTSCLRSGFDKHCTIQAHSGSAHRCDLCVKTYPIRELAFPPTNPALLCGQPCVGFHDTACRSLQKMCFAYKTKTHDVHRCASCSIFANAPPREPAVVSKPPEVAPARKTRLRKDWKTVKCVATCVRCKVQYCALVDPHEGPHVCAFC